MVSAHCPLPSVSRSVVLQALIRFLTFLEMLARKLNAPFYLCARTVRSQTFPSTTAPTVPPTLLSASPQSSSHQNTLATGQLIDDNTVTHLLKTRLSQPDVKQNGYILDGYPRTPEQAKLLLHTEQPPTLAIQIHLNAHTLRSRLASRRLQSCRADDKPAIFEKRLTIYGRYSHQINDVLSNGDVPVRIVHDVGMGIEAVFEDVRKAVGVERRVLLMGAPGCGKGTQGQLLSAATSAVHISTGDLLRTNYAPPASS
ncbi:unnamed protein product [Agarophyton chilense]